MILFGVISYLATRLPCLATAKIGLIDDWVGFKPKTTLNEGIKKFLYWYKAYYGV